MIWDLNNFFDVNGVKIGKGHSVTVRHGDEVTLLKPAGVPPVQRPIYTLQLRERLCSTAFFCAGALDGRVAALGGRAEDLRDVSQVAPRQLGLAPGQLVLEARQRRLHVERQLVVGQGRHGEGLERGEGTGLLQADGGAAAQSATRGLGAGVCVDGASPLSFSTRPSRFRLRRPPICH